MRLSGLWLVYTSVICICVSLITHSLKRRCAYAVECRVHKADERLVSKLCDAGVLRNIYSIYYTAYLRGVWFGAVLMALVTSTKLSYTSSPVNTVIGDHF